jgi:hypothetical protein
VGDGICIRKPRFESCGEDGECRREIGECEREIGECEGEIGESEREIGECEREIGECEREIGDFAFSLATWSFSAMSPELKNIEMKRHAMGTKLMAIMTVESILLWFESF